MIRHIVMWDVRGDTPEEKAGAAAHIKAGFEALTGRIPGLLTLEIGIGRSRIDYACDLVLQSEFESWQALEAYATHPEHLRLRDAVAGLRIARHQVDYAVETVD
ncbi:Dabb family protein [Novosphingobium rosa]|uniref:Dabb family protein n=1 Tax=Novosphingobium rosa TaxID=76978 RepID=UPI000833EC1B|nr:Dabb family protein [Novosphingobium rosa]